MRINVGALVAALCLLAFTPTTGCTLEVDQPDGGYVVLGPPDSVHGDTDVYYVYECYDAPYDYDPEWCELQAHVECCTWYIDGWYEEWCDWDYMGCWEYISSF